MTETFRTASDTLTNNLPYMGYGALGGYVGAFFVAKWNGIEGLQPLGRYQVESAIAGAVTNYIWLLINTGADTDSILKGMLIGFAGEWIYNKFVKGMLTEMNVVA